MGKRICGKMFWWENGFVRIWHGGNMAFGNYLDTNLASTTNWLLKIDSKTLRDIGKATKTLQKTICNHEYKLLVRSSVPEVLCSNKQGRRAGARDQLRRLKWQNKLKIPLPTLRKNFDHFEAITTTKKLQNCCVFAITESWITCNISDSQASIDNYTLVRSDR